MLLLFIFFLYLKFKRSENYFIFIEKIFVFFKLYGEVELVDIFKYKNIFNV